MTKKITPKERFLEARKLPTISSAPNSLIALRTQVAKANEILMRLSAEMQDAFPADDSDPPNPELDHLRQTMRAAFATAPDMEALLGETLPRILDKYEQFVISILPDDYAACMLNIFKEFRDLLAAMLSAYRYETTLMAFVELQESFNTFLSLPAIQASPLAVDFVARLSNDLGQSRDPREILASVGISTSAQHAADVRHSSARELKRRVLEEYERLKRIHPRISKNNAAIRIAPLAVTWNTELRAGLGTMVNNEKAQKQVRRWLSPSAKGDAMP